jgi:hypothetical protein
MSGENKKVNNINYYIDSISGAYGALLGCQHLDILIPGGHGGPGGTGEQGGTGGSGGKGEGPTVIFDHSTNKMYVGEVPHSFSQSPFSTTAV